MVESAVVSAASASSAAFLSFFLLFLLTLYLHSLYLCLLNFHLLFLLVFLFLLFLFSARLNFFNLDLLGCGFFILITVIHTSLLSNCDISSSLILDDFTFALILVELGALLGSPRYLCSHTALQLSDPRFDLCSVLNTKVSVSLLTKSINTSRNSSFGSKHTADLSLQLSAGLAHQLCVVDQSILGCVVLGLQCLE